MTLTAHLNLVGIKYAEYNERGHLTLTPHTADTILISSEKLHPVNQLLILIGIDSLYPTSSYSSHNTTPVI